jgi:hypothetical protein
MAHSGGCFCGQVRFHIDADPVGARLCWCRDCQRIASGSATFNVLFPQDAVHFTGTITTIERVADSGNVVRRGFCPVCGSQMYSATLNADTMPMRIRAGTLDNPELLAPQAIIWAASAPAWAILDPALPHFPGPPPTIPATLPDD